MKLLVEPGLEGSRPYFSIVKRSNGKLWLLAGDRTHCYCDLCAESAIWFYIRQLYVKGNKGGNEIVSRVE